MEVFIRIALWFVTFPLCLQARHLPQTDANIFYMRNQVTCPAESEFYAPTNIQVECITAALDCVMRELNGTVAHECQDPLGYVDPAVEFFELLLQEEAPWATEGCACERWPQAAFGTFLDQVESLLQLQQSVSAM